MGRSTSSASSFISSIAGLFRFLDPNGAESPTGFAASFFCAAQIFAVFRLTSCVA